MRKSVSFISVLFSLFLVHSSFAAGLEGRLSGGTGFNLAVRDNGLPTGWGYNDMGQAEPPPLSGVVSVSAGFEHGLALLEDGTVVAWGSSYSQSLDVPYLSNVVQIAAGGNFSLALDGDGQIHAWGDNSVGQLDFPIELYELRVQAISAGMEHGLALLEDGTVMAWGGNWEGQTDVPLDLGPVTAISAGEMHNLALTQDGRVVAWGADWAGQATVPEGLTGMTAVSAGNMHSMALTVGGQVIAWGDNYDGQIDVPFELNDAVHISAGGFHSMAVRSDGSLMGWGSNYLGEADIPEDLILTTSGSGGGGSGGGGVTTDQDVDGMDDAWETLHGLDPFNPYDAEEDPDSDILTNLEEFQYGTDPFNHDTDGDTLIDIHEAVELGSNPTNPDTDGDGMDDGWEFEYQLDLWFNDASDDLDGDGLSNFDEYNLNTFPNQMDTDGDVLADGEELNLGLNPIHPDTDRDGLSDGDELAYGMDPLNRDTYGNGVPDGLEIQDSLRVNTPLNSDQIAENKGVAISGDGRFTAFVSDHPNLVEGDTNGTFDVFVYDRDTGVTQRVSVADDGSQANGASGSYGNGVDIAISGDGRYVAFSSEATNLVADSYSQYSRQLFLHDRVLGGTILISRNSEGVPANGYCTRISLSYDGTRIAFRSSAKNLLPNGDGNAYWSDVFFRDLLTGETRPASVTPSGVTGNRDSDYPAISGDGRYIAFISKSSDLVPNDTNGEDGEDCFRYDVETNTLIRVSLNSQGQETEDGYMTYTSISHDGSRVAFTTSASNLVANDNNGQIDVFVRDVNAGTTIRASVRTDGGETESYSSFRGSTQPSLSADGNLVAFTSASWTLDDTDTNRYRDVYVHNLTSGETRLVSTTPSGGLGNSDSGRSGLALSADGTHVVFETAATNMFTGDGNYSRDIILKML